VTAAEKTKQIVEELSGVGRANVVFEVKFTNSFAQKDPQVFFIEDAEGLSGALQDVETVVVEGGRIYLFAEQRAYSIPHFFGSGHGVGKGQHLFGLRVLLLNQASDAVNQDGSLACAGAG